MFKNFSYICYLILKLFDNFFKLLFKKNFLYWIKEFFEKDSYKAIDILGKKINFFVPNQITEYRVNTIFTKEPETIEWINKFRENEENIFWDIGANIGLFSIYAATKYKNCNIVSFEPSTSNLRCLSRNISINNLQDRIKIFSSPLSNKDNKFLNMNESQFSEGAALNTFGEEFDFEGKKILSSNRYCLVGRSINSILEKKILDVPNYIKIDVDGIEHLILEGADKYLNNENLLSLSIEINENFKDQYERTLKIMESFDFKILHKKQNKKLLKSKNHLNSFNYVFIR
ncbi:FkbM family methyltransferase [Pelagibacterales bacterium SAG-MED19]|nr:FkbM family methyltransferase [Pelagibacterales bacterium SAG-MED19]